MIELAAAPQPKVPREQLAMPGTKFHHRIPILGRPFLQRNEVRLQRDQALQELARVRAQRDEAWRERDEALASRQGHRADDSEEARVVQTAEQARLAEEAEEETRTFREESYRDPDFLDAPGGIAVGQSIDDGEIIRRVVRAYKSDRLPDSKPTAVWNSSTLRDRRPFMTF
jgi:hypothetical protein